jgi:hypothetical protein
MKIWPLLIGIILLCALLGSPVLAISKNELIAHYHTIPESPAYPETTSGHGGKTEFKITPGFFPFTDEPLPLPKWVPNGSSDISIFSSEKNSLISFLKPHPSCYADDIPSRKPNIYLYSDRDLTAQVWLAPEDAITISDPVYRPGMGWQAEIRNGSLNGNGDFLFYESVVPDSRWQKDEGYVIRAAHREQDMASMLGPYGFNEKETAEFIDYWSSHLTGGVDYAFYPQEIDAVDRVMPLSVSPEPDHVSRIWFYAEPLVTAPEPVTSPEQIVRDGFYVVEWGVMIR